MSSTSNRKPKVLCLFADGTFKNLEEKYPTNISRLANTIRKRTATGRPIVSLYDSGIGTSGWTSDLVLGGALGLGIDLKIKELYTFLVMNYEKGDDICLFGFSRGAYTVRSLAGIISMIGLLSRDEINFVDEAYEYYRSKDKTSKHFKALRKTRARKVNIKLLVCFDTVGALGVPSDALFFSRALFNRKRYSFHDTTLSDIVENAIHACSIDEDRKAYLPTLMTPNAKIGNKQVTEMFLPGHHSGVGGGNRLERYCADIALHFVIDEIKRRTIDIAFDNKLLPDLEKANKKVKVVSPTFWSRTNIVRLLTGIKARTIPDAQMLHPIVPTLYKRDSTWRPVALKNQTKFLLD